MIKKKYHQHKETIHNFIWRALQVVGKQGITFLIFILCAKLLSPYDFGIYNYVLAIIFFLIMFGDFGISTATSKYVAEYNLTNKGKLKSVLFNSGIIIVGLTILVVLLTIIIGPAYLKEKYVYVLWLLPLIFLAPMTSLYDGIYRGLKRFKQLAIISTIVGFISLSFVYILIKQYGLIGALWAQSLFYLILFIALASGYKEFNFKWNKEVMKEVGKYSLIVGTSLIGYFLFSKISTVLLGYFGYIQEIGYYEIVNRIILLCLLPFTIISQVISPDITIKYSKKKSKIIILKKYKKYLLLTTVIASILAFGIYLLFPFIIKIFLNEYSSNDLLISMNYLLVILITQSIATIVSSGFAISTGHAKVNMVFLIIFGVINVPLNFLMIKHYGFIGAIYATLIVRLSSDLIYFYTYYHILKNESSKKV